jgi:hypothetical protein
VSYDSQLLWTVTNLVEDYLSDFLVNDTLPVKMFRLEIGRKRDEDMVQLEGEINEFEAQLEERGMQINNITMSNIAGAADLYCIVLYGFKTSRDQDEI